MNFFVAIATTLEPVPTAVLNLCCCTDCPRKAETVVIADLVNAILHAIAECRFWSWITQVKGRGEGRNGT